MPDHLHVLVSIPDGISLKAFAHRFKQISGFRLKRELDHSPWQVSYFDHVLRHEESLLDVANYIWENPVRAGLADSREAYLYSGPKDRLDGRDLDDSFSIRGAVEQV